MFYFYAVKVKDGKDKKAPPAQKVEATYGGSNSGGFMSSIADGIIFS